MIREFQQEKSPIGLYLIAIVLSLVVYLCVANPWRLNYLGYVVVEPEKIVGFELVHRLPGIVDKLKFSAWSVNGSHDGKFSKSAFQSSPFLIAGNTIRLEYFATQRTSGQMHWEVKNLDRNSAVIKKSGFTIPHTGRFTNSREQFLTLPKDWEGESAIVLVKLISAKSPVRPQASSAIPGRLDSEEISEPFFAIRSRVEFYSLPQFLLTLDRLAHNAFSMVVAVLLLSFVLWSVLPRIVDDLASRFSWTLFLTLAGLLSLVGLRWNVYYHWDEWQAIEHFRNAGLSGVNFAHNEHYLPLFWLWYYFQLIFWGDSYLGLIATSFALLVANSGLVYLLLEKLRNVTQFGSRQASIYVALFYSLNPLHAEVVRWAFVQCILMQLFLSLAALLLFTAYMESKNLGQLFLALCLITASPFLFANAFVFPLLLVSLALFIAYIKYQRGFAVGEARGQFYRWTFVLSLVGASFVFCAAMYYTNRFGQGHSLDNRLQHGPVLGNIPLVGKYLAVGSQFGTLLRGLGMFPTLAINGGELLLGNRILGMDWLVFLGICGFVVSLGILIITISQRRESRRIVIAYWLLGQSFLVSSFLLPSIARFDLGANQSLSLRYQSQALVGVCIMLIPLVHTFISVDRLAYWARTGAFLFLGSVLTTGMTFQSLSSDGLENRYMFERFDQWFSIPVKERQRIALPTFDQDKMTPAYGYNTVYRNQLWLMGDNSGSSSLP